MDIIDVVRILVHEPDYQLSFPFMGIDITDPFMDETGRFEVNPFSYYGQHFIESSFITEAQKLQELPCLACGGIGCNGSCAR